jgi:hypothetical protein
VCISGCASQRSWVLINVNRYHNIDLAKYDKVFYTICDLTNEEVLPRDNHRSIFVSCELRGCLLGTFKYKLSNIKRVSIHSSSDYYKYLNDVTDKSRTLFIRGEFEYEKSRYPRRTREGDYIREHRGLTQYFLIDPETQETLAELTYQRSYLDGKIPEQVLGELLLKSIKENIPTIQIRE